MKNKTIKFSFLIIIIFVTFLYFKSNKDIVDVEWELEGYNYMPYNDDLDKEKHNKNDIKIKFTKKKSFILSDNKKNKKWIGTYKIEKNNPFDNTYRIYFFVNNTKIFNTGVYGIKKYINGEKIPTLTIQTDDKIISFTQKNNIKSREILIIHNFTIFIFKIIITFLPYFIFLYIHYK